MSDEQLILTENGGLGLVYWGMIIGIAVTHLATILF